MQHLASKFVYIAIVSIFLILLVLMVLRVFKNIAKPQNLISAYLIPLRYIVRCQIRFFKLICQSRYLWEFAIKICLCCNIAK